MSCIRCTLNFQNKEWLIQKISFQPTWTNVEIVVISEEEYTEVKGTDFKFGFNLSSANEIVIQENYPPTGVRYELIGRGPIGNSRINFLPERNYTFEVYADISGIRIEKTLTFYSDRPSQPFPSWTWNGSEWIAPIEKPLDQLHIYAWNEDDQAWIRISSPPGYMQI